MNWSRLRRPAFVAALSVLVLAGAGMQAAIERYRIYLRKLPIQAEGGRILRAVPDETQSWIRLGTDHVEEAETLEVLGTENYLTRVYVEKSPPPGRPPRRAQLHVAYYTGMIDTVPHVVERCLIGGGMSLVGGPWTTPLALDTATWQPSPDGPGDGTLFTVRLSNEWSKAGRGRRVNLPHALTPDRPLSLRVNAFAIGSRPKGAPSPAGGGAEPHLFAGYFFIANGGWVSTAEGVRFLAFNLTDDYAYYLKVQIGSYDVSSPEELAAIAGSLLSDLLGELMTCVPDWPKVQRGEWPPDNPKRPQTRAAGRP